MSDEEAGLARSRHLFVAALLLLAAGAGTAGPATAAWGGEGCAPAAELRAIVDAALELAPYGRGRGSGAPGLSVAVQHDDCGRFAHAVGLRAVEGRQPNQVTTRQHIGSMTKPVASALALILAEQGLLGPRGIDARVGPFFTRAERRQLTRGSGPGRLCPATVQALDRTSPRFVTVRARCPRLKKITVRQLLNGNHGLWDFVNEIDRNANGFVDPVDYLLGDMLEALGFERLPPPGALETAFDVVGTTGLLQANGARRGGRRRVDFEVSFGNTGYQLLGLILERVSGRSFDELVEEHITGPLKLEEMSLVAVPPDKRRRIASEYMITSGAEQSGLAGLGEDLRGLYPLVDINGHPAVNLFDLELFAFTNGGGAAGALSAAPDSYVQFFHALVSGRLLSPAAQRVLEDGFLQLEDAPFEHGFALFRSTGTIGTTLTKGGATAGSNCLALHSVAGAGGGNGVTVVACRNSADLFLPNPAASLGNTSVSVETLTLDLVQRARP